MGRSPLVKAILRSLKIAVAMAKDPKINDSDACCPFPEDRESSRREFLTRGGQVLAASSLVGLAGGGLPGCLKDNSNVEDFKPAPSPLAATFPEATPSKVAIVGAGLSGLTLAYRLLQNGFSTQVFEGSPRVGGRTLTQRGFNDQGMFCEQGGELVDTGHEELRVLCQDLGIPLQPLNSAITAPLATDLFSVDGQNYSEKQLIKALRPLARALVQDQKQLRDGDSLAVPTFENPIGKNPAVQALDRMPLSQYLENSGMDRWAQRLVATAYMTEYGLESDQQSALNLIILMGVDSKKGIKIYGESDEAFRIEGGSDRLAKTLASRLKDRSPIYLEHRLVALRPQGERIRLVFDVRGQTREVTAEMVVLTLPPSVLKTIDLRALPLTPVTNLAIHSWGMGTNSKLMFGFKKRYWHDLKSNGSAYLSPFGQCWETSRMQTGSAGILTAYTGGLLGQKPPKDLPQRAMASLNTVYPKIASHFDGNHSVNHWSLNPWSLGSYSCPRVGQYTSIYGAFSRIELGGRLLFAGEHSSIDYAGYMNGAINSANRVADLLVKKRRVTRI